MAAKASHSLRVSEIVSKTSIRNGISVTAICRENATTKATIIKRLLKWLYLKNGPVQVPHSHGIESWDMANTVKA